MRLGKRRQLRENDEPVKTVDMHEGLRTSLALKTMLGSRGVLVAFTLLVVGLTIGYLIIRQPPNPSKNAQTTGLKSVREADRLWDNDENVAAVRMYKDLLNLRDPARPEFPLIPRRDRPRMFRRIITHEAVYGSPQEARDWISRAFLEGINFERVDFEHDHVFQLWQQVTAPFREQQRREIDASRSRDLLDELNKDDAGKKSGN